MTCTTSTSQTGRQDTALVYWLLSVQTMSLADSMAMGHTCPYYTPFSGQVWAPRHTYPRTDPSGMGREVLQGEAGSWMLLDLSHIHSGLAPRALGF